MTTRRATRQHSTQVSKRLYNHPILVRLSHCYLFLLLLVLLLCLTCLVCFIPVLTWVESVVRESIASHHKGKDRIGSAPPTHRASPHRERIRYGEAAIVGVSVALCRYGGGTAAAHHGSPPAAAPTTSTSTSSTSPCAVFLRPEWLLSVAHRRQSAGDDG